MVLSFRFFFALVGVAVKTFQLNKLTAAVRAEARRVKVAQLKRRQDELKERLSGAAAGPPPTDAEVAAARAELDDIGRRFFNADLMTDEQLFDDPDLPVDWNKIAFEEFHNGRTGRQLSTSWRNLYCPTVRKCGWNHVEAKQFKVRPRQVSIKNIQYVMNVPYVLNLH